MIEVNEFTFDFEEGTFASEHLEELAGAVLPEVDEVAAVEFVVEWLPLPGGGLVLMLGEVAFGEGGAADDEAFGGGVGVKLPVG